MILRAARVAALTFGAALPLAGRLVWAAGRGRERRHAIMGQSLARLLSRLGPTYVKVGQILATRADLLPVAVIDQLRGLQDAASPVDLAAMTRGRDAELGIDLRRALAAIEDTPFASGSVACVYRGRTQDGRAIAVKIRRRGVGDVIAQDVACIRAAMRFAATWRLFRDAPVEAVGAEVCAALEQQLDFDRERAMAERLAQGFAGEPAVVLPQPLPELCGPAVLTMTLIDAFTREQPSGTDDARRYAEAARAGLRALYRMIFVEGAIHCDLHDGNIRLMDDGRAAIVDFGLVVPMAPEDRLKFAEFFYAVAVNDGRHAADITLDTAMTVSADLDRAAFEAEIVDLVGSLGRTPETFSVSDFVVRLFDIQRRHRVRGTPKFIAAILSLFVFEGIVRQWLPQLDFQREAQRFIFMGAFPRSAAA
ncbi:MAG: AarF/ABC1/UbiB kinase family protein [Pseudolabrys sp.]|nr:AarF/ABC1/UbiB kinase family protein [Pseudolabrys sp.]